MDAIVTAGGIPLPEDPLYPYSQGHAKALIHIAGKPMIQWVLDALSDAKSVDNVIVVGLSKKVALACKKPLTYVSNQGQMLPNLAAGLQQARELNPKAEYALLVSSDIPALRPEMIDWLVETAMQTQDELYYGVIPRDVMEKRYPNARRTWVQLKDMAVCGADLNIAHISLLEKYMDTWEQLLGARKSPLRQAAIIGLDTLIQFLLRRLTLNDVVQRVTSRIGVRSRAIIWEYAEPGMDVDKPHQLEIMQSDLSPLSAS